MAPPGDASTEMEANEVQVAQAELIEEFRFFDNWMDRYQYLVDLGRQLPPLAPDEQVDANKIRGCQSQVWFVAENHGERLRFRATSDAAIVSGLIAILLRIYSDRRPRDILDSTPDFVEALDLQQHLSPTRSNGLASMLTAIRGFATEATAAA